MEDTAEAIEAKPEDTAEASETKLPVLVGVFFDRAKTSRAKCGGCGETLNLGDERIAKEINSQHGKIIKSYHPLCGIALSFNEDNRSKCVTCGEKLTMGDVRVKIGCTSKSGPGTKHHYDCLFTKSEATNDHAKLQQILEDKKTALKEEDRPPAGPKVKKAKKSRVQDADKEADDTEASTL